MAKKNGKKANRVKYTDQIREVRKHFKPGDKLSGAMLIERWPDLFNRVAVGDFFGTARRNRHINPQGVLFAWEERLPDGVVKDDPTIPLLSAGVDDFCQLREALFGDGELLSLNQMLDWRVLYQRGQPFTNFKKEALVNFLTWLVQQGELKFVGKSRCVSNKGLVLQEELRRSKEAEPEPPVVEEPAQEARAVPEEPTQVEEAPAAEPTHEPEPKVKKVRRRQVFRRTATVSRQRYDQALEELCAARRQIETLGAQLEGLLPQVDRLIKQGSGLSGLVDRVTTLERKVTGHTNDLVTLGDVEEHTDDLERRVQALESE